MLVRRRVENNVGVQPRKQEIQEIDVLKLAHNGDDGGLFAHAFFLQEAQFAVNLINAVFPVTQQVEPFGPAKQELARIPFFGKAMEAAGHIFVDRTDRQKSVQSLRLAGEKMRRDHSTVIIFPEGTRSANGELQPFKKGAFMLALEGGVRLLPVVIQGSDEILHLKSMRVTPRTIHIYFGDPIEPDERSADELMAVVRGQMLEIMTAIDNPSN